MGIRKYSLAWVGLLRCPLSWVTVGGASHLSRIL